jgi:hypothetical protein
MTIVRWSVVGLGAGALTWAVSARAAAPPEEECVDGVDVVEFGYGSSKLNEEAREALDDVAKWMRDNDERSVTVEGYTDPSGNASSNQKLSERRAQSVERYLNKQGIDADRVETYGRGEEKDTASNEDARVVVVNRCEAQPGAASETQPAETGAGVVETPPPPPAEPAPTPPPVETAPALPPAPPPATAEVQAAPSGPHELPTKYGIAVSAGGGIIGFTDQETRNQTDVGGAWDVRAVFVTRFPLGLELGYTGSAQRISSTGLDPDAFLVGNGADASLRLQLPDGLVRPYAFGGIGWTYYTVTNTSVAGTGVADNDSVGVVPFGIGVAVGNRGGFQFDLRLTGRWAFDDTLLNGTVAGTGKTASLDSLGVTARVGYEF